MDSAAGSSYVVYPATQARDLNILGEKLFGWQRSQPVDMFPTLIILRYVVHVYSGEEINDMHLILSGMADMRLGRDLSFPPEIKTLSSLMFGAGGGTGHLDHLLSNALSIALLQIS